MKVSIKMRISSFSRSLGCILAHFNHNSWMPIRLPNQTLFVKSLYTINFWLDNPCIYKLTDTQLTVVTMSFNPEDDDERSPCSFFCLWTHLHGWRNFALAKNKGYWVIWIIFFLITILFAAIAFYGHSAKYYMGLVDFYGRWDTIGQVSHSRSKIHFWSNLDFYQDWLNLN